MGYTNIDDIRRSGMLAEHLRTAANVKRKHHKNRRNAVYCPNCGDAGAEIFQSTTSNPGVWMVKCHAPGCGICWDFVGLYQHEHGLDSRTDAILEITGRITGITSTNKTEATVAEIETEPELEQDFAGWFSEVSEYCRRCRSALTPASYGAKVMAARGFRDVGFLRRYAVGFDARATGHGSLPFPRAAIILPFDSGGTYYVARFCETSDKRFRFTKPDNKKYPTGWSAPIFHAGQLYRNFDSVFVVEGEVDALSINYAADVYGLNVGAVATSGAANWGKLTKHLQEKPMDAGRLVIAFDNDAAGRGNSIGLSQELEDMGVEHIIVDMESSMMLHGWTDGGEPCNDVNDVLSGYGVEAVVSFISSADEMRTSRRGIDY